MNRRDFSKKAGKALLATSGAAALAGCGGSSRLDSVSLRINGYGEWSGSIGSAGSSKTVSGQGRETYSFREVPDVVSATIQKKERGDTSELTVQILADGEVVKQSSTTAEYGVVSVSESFY